MKALSFRCLRCLYYLGILKCIVSPCMSCKILGGQNAPISLKSITKDKTKEEILMTEQLLKRQIKQYGNDAVRFNLKANRCYAAYKEYRDKNDFLNSQKYYEMSRRATPYMRCCLS